MLKLLPDTMATHAHILYSYAYAMSLAFFEVFLAKNANYCPYLQAAYAEYISQTPFNLYLISAASADALSQKYADLKWVPGF
ncbi:MAG: hypothetical protein F6K19_50190 [Cyanothece sp. SIO1E1]|nr:hypothetical protein [Cyanothece sp. SIO1E1]